MRSGDKPATIYDVARAAGVSHQSVSRVLRGVVAVREDTKARVEAALADLDYRPSAVARELAYSRRNRIGVVGYEAFEASTGKVLKGIDEVARREGFVLEIVTVDPLGDVDEIARQLDAINGMDVAGLLATSPTVPIRTALEGSVFRMPVHVDDQLDSPLGGDLSARLVVQHLLDLGHRRIAHIAGPLEWDSARDRRAAYFDLLRAHALEALPVVEGDWTAQSGYEAVARLPWPERPTALFVANDRMALGVLRALQERGLRVPRDISVVGIDDIPEAAYFSTPLTTVHVDFVGSGRVAAERLVDRIRGVETQRTSPALELVVRASTAAPTI